MIFTIPNLIRLFLSVCVGRVEYPLCVLQSVMRHRKISLKENASYLTEHWALSMRINASTLLVSCERARCSAFMPSSGFMRSLLNSDLKEPTIPVYISIMSTRQMKEKLLLLFREFRQIKSYFRSKYPRSLNNLALNFWSMLAWVDIVQELDLFIFIFCLSFCLIPFFLLHFSLRFLFKFSVLHTWCFFVCLYLSDFVLQYKVSFSTQILR